MKSIASWNYTQGFPRPARLGQKVVGEQSGKEYTAVSCAECAKRGSPTVFYIQSYAANRMLSRAQSPICDECCGGSDETKEARRSEK